jgi:DNA repair protein RecO (recombination protein O)
MLPGARELPPDARATIIDWIDRGDVVIGDEPSARAHLRLFREFLQEHLGDERPLRAFSVWEKGIWIKR